jgi:hypothetical protein
MKEGSSLTFSFSAGNLLGKNSSIGREEGEMKKDSGPDRRGLSRTAPFVDVAFHVYGAEEKRPLTRKVRGRLTNISPKGACLQTDQTLIDGYHLMLDDDIEGGTPLIIELLPSSEGTPLVLKAQVLWYNRIASERPFHFSIGLKFIDLSPAERKQLENLLRSASTTSKA